MTVLSTLVGNVVTKLRTITVANGYGNDVAAVRDWAANAANEPQFPVLLVNVNRTLYEAGPIRSAANMLTRRLGVLVEGWVQNPQDRSAAAISLLGDVEKALTSDHTLGGTALDVILIANELVAADERDDRSGFLLEIEIVFRTPHTDPNTVA